MNLKSKIEDITFSVIQHLPIIPSFLMNWADNYLNRRIAELNHETICQQWDKASLEKTLSEIHERQQSIEKAPTEDVFSSASAYGFAVYRTPS